MNDIERALEDLDTLVEIARQHTGIASFGVGTLADLIVKDRFIKILEKLYEYEELEEQGLLIKLPCKVGTELFHVRTEIYADGYSVEHKKVIKEIELTNHNIFEIKRNWNKTVFLTREEAEKALEGNK